jgi:hypothetical protein
MGEIVPPMMGAGLLPIALYRTRSSRSARYHIPYVLTNPPHSTVLRNSDRIYVLIRESGSVAYTVSVKRLERASRSIQRYFRQMKHMRWQKKYLAEAAVENGGVYALESVLVSERQGGNRGGASKQFKQAKSSPARLPNPGRRPRLLSIEDETLEAENYRSSRSRVSQPSPLTEPEAAGAGAQAGSAQAGSAQAGSAQAGSAQPSPSARAPTVPVFDL